jgi:hypothetical protein
MPEGLPEGPEARIEMFQSRSAGLPPLDLQPLWRCEGPEGPPGARGTVPIGMPAA